MVTVGKNGGGADVGRGGDNGNGGDDDREGGDGEDADDKADGQYKLWSRITDSLKHHPGPGEYQKMKPVPVRCLELGAALSHQGVISGIPDALPFISHEPFIFLSLRHPQQSINQILPIEAENNSGMKT